MTKIDENDCRALQNLKQNSIVMQLKSEAAAVESARALAEANVAGLKYQNVLLKIYLKYGLTENHIIDESTGEVKEKNNAENKDDQGIE